MVRQCNCGMSLLRRQCPRDGFPCKRCLTRMKNRGLVWQIDFPGARIAIDPGDGATTVWQFGSFTRDLYWDYQSPAAFTSTTYGNDYDSPECSCGTYGDGSVDFPASVINWTDTPSGAGINDIELYVFWYRESWYLAVYCPYFIGLKSGSSDELAAYAWALYTSGESGCFFDENDGIFTLDEWDAVSGTAGITLDKDSIVTGTDIPFPREITFRQVDYHGSDVEA